MTCWQNGSWLSQFCVNKSINVLSFPAPTENPCKLAFLVIIFLIVIRDYFEILERYTHPKFLLYARKIISSKESFEVWLILKQIAFNSTYLHPCNMYCNQLCVTFHGRRITRTLLVSVYTAFHFSPSMFFHFSAILLLTCSLYHSFHACSTAIYSTFSTLFSWIFFCILLGSNIEIKYFHLVLNLTSVHIKPAHSCSGFAVILKEFT